MNYKGIIVISFILVILSLATVSASELDQTTISDSYYDDSIIVDDPVSDSSCDDSLIIDDYVPDSPSDDSNTDDEGNTPADADEDGSADAGDDEEDDSSESDEDPSNSDITDDDTIISNITNDVPASNVDNRPISNLKEATGSFDELQSLINQAPSGTVLYLFRDYKGSENNQINIDKDLTLDGQGHTLDCAKLCRAIHSSSGSIILRNLNIINGYINGDSVLDDVYNGSAISIEGTAKYTIENCVFDSNWADDYGGAISNAAGKTLTIRNSTFKNNQVDDKVGGAINTLGAVYIYDSIFEHNQAYRDGGAIRIFTNQTCKIYNCKFNSNKAGSAGGAIYIWSKLYIYNSTFSNNIAEDSGGAIHACRDTYVENCLFEQNKADGTIKYNAQGGAICEGFGNLTIVSSTFNNNYVDDRGGAIYAEHNVYINNNQSDNQAYNTFFNGNIADDCDGGAIKCLGNVFIKNTAFTSNKAYTNGGAFSLNGNCYFTHCLFNSNQCLGSSSQCQGGAIYTLASTSLTDCILSNNYAEDDGGAVYSRYTVNADNCTFNDNSAGDYGGAIYASTINVNKNQKSGKSYFTNNHALDDNGGAIYATESVDAFNTIFNSNSALVDGGAIYAKDNVIVQDSTFNSNVANGAKSHSCYGGAICSDGVTVINSIFKNNYAENYGGAIYANVVYLVSGQFEGNVASKNDGGAIYTDYFLNNNIKDTTFYNNRACADGGAIYVNKENSLTFSQCTFVINHCDDEGGAIYLDSTSSNLQLINNIFLGNTAKEGYVAFNKGSYGTIWNNWWGDLNPSYDLAMLVEWKMFSSNENKIDIDPLRIAMNLDKHMVNLGEHVTATFYFIKSDGSTFTGQIPISAMAFILPDDFKPIIYVSGGNSISVEFVANKVGYYEIIGNLYGQFATQVLTVYDLPILNNIQNIERPQISIDSPVNDGISVISPVLKSIDNSQFIGDFNIFSELLSLFSILG